MLCTAKIGDLSQLNKKMYLSAAKCPFWKIAKSVLSIPPLGGGRLLGNSVSTKYLVKIGLVWSISENLTKNGNVII